MIVLWFEMRKNMFFFTRGYKAINPYKILVFYLLTTSYLFSQMILRILEGFSTDIRFGSYNFYLHYRMLSLMFRFDAVKYRDLIYLLFLCFNPLNLLLKYMILKFDLFTEIAIEV